MTNHTKSKSIFISQNHIGYNTSVNIESLNPQHTQQYKLDNITQMQVKDLQVAMMIYESSNKDSSKDLYKISTLDRPTQVAMQISKPIHTQNANSYPEISLINNATTKYILDIKAIIVEFANILHDSDNNNKTNDINHLIEQIQKTLDFICKQKIQIKDDVLPNTQKMLNQAIQTISDIQLSINDISKQSEQDFKNRFNKDIIILSANIIKATYGPIVAYILITKFGHKLALQILLKILGLAAGPIVMAISITLLLVDIYDFIVNIRNESETITAAYKLYSVILCIYEKLDYSLASLINFTHIGDGNLITKQNVYYLYPDYKALYSSSIATFLTDNEINANDIFYRANVSIKNNKDKYLANIFEVDNKLNSKDSSIENTDSSKKYFDNINTQFSTFSLNHLYNLNMDNDDNFTTSSAFCHLRNILLKFDGFLFVKSSSFSSILMNDLFIQSFTSSQQNNPARINKTALFLTNCLHNGLPEYKVQQHIKDTLLDNETIKDNVLFISAMYRVNKVNFANHIIKTMTELFNKLENYAHFNQAKKINLTQQFGALIKKYNIGNVSCTGNCVNSYIFDDKKICNLDVNEFCYFIHDLCNIIVQLLYSNMADDISNISLQSYSQDEENTSKTKEEDIKHIFTNIVSIVADVSTILSCFNAYDIVKTREYQDDIDKQYKEFKKTLNTIFDNKDYIFYGNETIKKICLYILDRYFNKATISINEDMKNTKCPYMKYLIENRKSYYYQITTEYVIPLLPLDKSLFLALEEEEAFTLCIGVIYELINQTTEEARYITDLYMLIISFYLLYDDKEANHKVQKLYEKMQYNNNNNNTANFIESIIDAIYDITKNASQEILKDEIKNILQKLGDKYGIITAIAFKGSTKDTLKEIFINIANDIDKKYTHSLQGLSKISSIFSIITRSAITYMLNALLDKIFPTVINNIHEMKQKTANFIFALNRHRDMPYATCKVGSKYFTIPITINQTLISADIKAVIIGGSPLDSGICMHTPSVAILNENEDNAINIIKNTLRNFINSNVKFNHIGGKGSKVFKEAYAKLWFYLDMGKNDELEAYLRNEINVNPNYYTLRNITSDKYIQAKLKKSKKLDNSDENFIEVEGNAKGRIRFNRDFLIQLKRMAEYNYGVYCEKEEYIIQSNKSNNKKSEEDQTKVSFEATLLGNLIYDEEYIPTTIDVK